MQLHLYRWSTELTVYNAYMNILNQRHRNCALWGLLGWLICIALLELSEIPQHHHHPHQKKKKKPNFNPAALSKHDTHSSEQV